MLPVGSRSVQKGQHAIQAVIGYNLSVKSSCVMEKPLDLQDKFRPHATDINKCLLTYSRQITGKIMIIHVSFVNSITNL